jgi:glutathione S-transferase
MKLYFVPGTCALAPHIFARQANIPLDVIKVDWTAEGMKVEGRDYLTINPKGKVPALETDGIILTETQVILQYLAQSATPADNSASGQLAHWRLLETLNFIACEIHKAFSPQWVADLTPVVRANLVKGLYRNFTLFEQMLGAKPYLMGESFTIADAYAYTVLRWSEVHHIDMADFQLITAYRNRISALPGVQQALREEGLLKAAN